MKQVDFTNTNGDGFIEGLLVKKYRDGETLVKIFFENWDTERRESYQDEVETWLSRQQVMQLIETLQEEV